MPSERARFYSSSSLNISEERFIRWQVKSDCSLRTPGAEHTPVCTPNSHDRTNSETQPGFWKFLLFHFKKVNIFEVSVFSMETHWVKSQWFILFIWPTRWRLFVTKVLCDNVSPGALCCTLLYRNFCTQKRILPNDAPQSLAFNSNCLISVLQSQTAWLTVVATRTQRC